MSKKQKYNYKKLVDSDTFASKIDGLKNKNFENISEIEKIIKKQFNNLRIIKLDDAESQELDERERKIKDAYDNLINSLEEYKQAYNSFIEAIKDYYTEIIDDCNKRSSN